MARSKSIPGSKTSRAIANSTKEQTVTETPVNVAAPSVVASETAGAEVAEDRRVVRDGKATPESRPLEFVKTDSRKNLVPINLEDEVRRRAYELYQQRGSEGGSEADDWLTAEREVRQRYRQQSA